MPKIIYGTDTGSIEDYYQCVVLVLNDDEVDLLDDGSVDPLSLGQKQTIVTWEDVRGAMDLAMDAEGIGIVTRARVLTTVRDAIDNND